MNEFNNYHPSVSLCYFTAVTIFTMLVMNPIFLSISFAASFVYSLMLGGEKFLKSFFTYILPLMLITAIVNPAFSHAGTTILCYLPSGNPLTLESIFYGIEAAFMLASVMCCFSCFNKIMTSDKLMYILGKITPSLSLIISMALRFVPRFKEQYREICASQKCLGRDISEGSIVKRAKTAISVMSVMIGQSMENAIDTADSMKSRGYGLPRRTAFSNYSLSTRDKITLTSVLTLTAYVLFGVLKGAVRFTFYPSIGMEKLTAYRISLLTAYAVLCTLPIIIEIKEAVIWKKLR